MKNPVDIYVGMRIRHRRWVLGMTQQKLAQMIGIKFQQIQKYETGSNRVSASRLWDISKALEVQIAYFFDGIEPDSDETTQQKNLESLANKEIANLIRSYHEIPEGQRRKLLELAKTLAAD